MNVSSVIYAIFRILPVGQEYTLILDKTVNMRGFSSHILYYILHIYYTTYILFQNILSTHSKLLFQACKSKVIIIFFLVHIIIYKVKKFR